LFVALPKKTYNDRSHDGSEYVTSLVIVIVIQIVKINDVPLRGIIN